MGLYLVAYDIRDRNRWHKVHHMLIAGRCRSNTAFSFSMVPGMRSNAACQP